MSEHQTRRNWQSDLIERHPRLFNVAQHGGTYTPGYPECGQGWRDLLQRACARIEAALAGGETIQVVQIKEKFAGLRLYWRGEVSPESRALHLAASYRAIRIPDP